MIKRSPRNHFPLCIEDVNSYFSIMVGIGFPVAKAAPAKVNKYFNNRRSTFNKLNCYSHRVVHIGNVFVYLNPSRFHIGLKLGSFTKTRKPFFFRSKKKKKQFNFVWFTEALVDLCDGKFFKYKVIQVICYLYAFLD